MLRTTTDGTISRRWLPVAVATLLLLSPAGARPAAAEEGSFAGPLPGPEGRHSWYEAREELKGNIEVVELESPDGGVEYRRELFPDLREQMALDFRAVIAAKERCSEEGDEEARRLLDRMRRARASLDPVLELAEGWYTAIGQPGFFENFPGPENPLGGAGYLKGEAERIVGLYRDLARELDEQIADAEAYDPCGPPDDALPEGDPEDGAEPEVGEKAKDQLAIGSTSGRAIPGATVTLVSLPDPDGGDDPVAADAPPDDESQQEAGTVVVTGTYVVKAPCHEEKVVSGADLLDGGVLLEPKDEPQVVWVPIQIPLPPGATLEERLRALEGPTVREVLARAERLVREELGGDLDDYEVEIEHHESLLQGLGVWLFEVTLRPKRRPCPDALPEGGDPVVAGDPVPGGDPPDSAQVAGDPPPSGDDDPGVDPMQPVPPPEGTIERTVPREDKRPAPPGTGADPFLLSAGTWGQEYPDQWGLRRIGFDPGAPPLLPAVGEPVVVALVDTGVDRTHPDLAGALWVNEGEVPGNGLDDDGNGYADDIHGWNFADDGPDTLDLNGHGTVTAGIIAARTGNGLGIAGVNPWARVMPIRVTTWSGRSTNLRLADAIRYAVDNGARVINLSYGGRRRTWSEYLAVAYARSRGVIVVAAAGNDGAEAADESPAGLPGVITVAASGIDDERLGFSNWGPGVDVAAPGLDILSLRARHTDLLRFKRDDYRPGAVIVGEDRRYYRLTGTSFSAPFVSGVASLIWSLRPDLTDMQVMRMVLHSAHDVGTPGWDQFTGYGRLDARAALAADPDRYLLARLTGVAVRRAADGPVIEVSGRASADRFRRAWIEIGRGGAGEPPRAWEKVGDDLERPVDRGVLAAIPADRFRGGSAWVLRLVVEHADGSRREARFELSLG